VGGVNASKITGSLRSIGSYQFPHRLKITEQQIMTGKL